MCGGGGDHQLCFQEDISWFISHTIMSAMNGPLFLTSAVLCEKLRKNLKILKENHQHQYQHQHQHHNKQLQHRHQYQHQHQYQHKHLQHQPKFKFPIRFYAIIRPGSDENVIEKGMKRLVQYMSICFYYIKCRMWRENLWISLNRRIFGTGPGGIEISLRSSWILPQHSALIFCQYQFHRQKLCLFCIGLKI